MADYLRPGVYVEEKQFETPPVTGGQASVGAFVGYTPRGPVKEPVYVTSWTDYVNKFALGASSPFMSNAYLSYALYGFFLNGGQSAWVVRATDGSEVKATVSLTNGTAAIAFTAKEAGVWGNRLSVKITAGVGTGKYNLDVYVNGVVAESFKNWTIASLSAGDYLATVVNAQSKYITVATTALVVDPTSIGTTKTLIGGTDGLTAVTSTKLNDAVVTLDSVDTINLLVLPESQATDFITMGIAYAEKRKDCVFIFDGGQNDTVTTIQTFDDNFNSDFGALYFPWVQVSDPIGGVNKTKYIPSAGYVAGMIARNDANRGIFKAPAGVECGLMGVLGLKVKITSQDQDILNPRGINAIRALPDAGIVVWGARTSSNNYLNVRRELNYVMGAILRSTRWAVFEPNNDDLWRKISNQLVAFLEGRRLLGAYKGAGEGTAYFVKCDSELNTQAEIDAGRVNTDVGVSINKPGEFIIFRVGQWDGGGAVSQ